MYCLLPLYALLTVAAAQGVGTPSHFVVLDAGNTTTQLKIFEEALVHSRYGPDARIKLIYSKAFPPGVRTVLQDPISLRPHLESILNEARRQIVSAYFEWTTLYVMATSDLRFLPVEEMEFILQSLRDLLNGNQTLNPFQFEPANVQLLSGEDEGAYSWLSANYLLGAFDRRRYQNETVGVLDMGNGSTQITFIPEEPIYSEKYPLKFRGRKHELYVQNYLQHGSESIFVKIHNVLVNRSMSGARVLNPCLLKDDVKRVQISDGTTVEHLGSGDPDTCEEILAQILTPSTGDDCQPKPCVIGRVYQPQVKEVQFLATVGFVYTPTALGVIDETKILYLDRLRQAGRLYCRKTVSEVVVEYEKDVESASEDCLMGLYIPTLLRAYGFSLDTRQIRLVPDVEGEPIGLLPSHSKGCHDKMGNPSDENDFAQYLLKLQWKGLWD